MQHHVLVFPSDGTGCAMYRMTWPGRAAAVTGKPVTVMPRQPQIVVDNNNQIKGINVGNAKIVVLQRPGGYQIPQIIPLLQAQGIAVVIDLDDDLSCIHPRNPAYKIYDPRLNHKVNFMHAQRSCEMANWVTVTTPALAERYGQHGRVTVIPNHIPESYLKIQRPLNEVPVVGWAGWTDTHPNDLQQTRGMINEVLTETKAKFLGYGDKAIFNNLQIRLRPPHASLGFTGIQDYPSNIAKFDIGLVPLENSSFNQAKSWLKALEYCSVGVVPVVTATYDNMRLVEMGAAVKAEKPKDWYDHVKELILDNDMREEMSKRCREVAAQFTIERNSDLWWECWQNA